MKAAPILLVTLDSCRLDTARAADTPFLDSLGPVRPAQALATFTLPAHVAMFAGFFPTSHLGGEPTTADAWPGSGSPLSGRRGHRAGRNYVDELRLDGYRTVGAAGMRWFLGDQLRLGFDEFHYWAPEHLIEDRDLPRWQSADYALHHADELAATVAGHPLWLLFVNAAQTHSPYMCTGELLLRQRDHADYRNAKLPLTSAGLALMPELAGAQALALQDIDRCLAALFEALPAGFQYLICADHGESFGEQGRWGHVHTDPSVLTVPLWRGFWIGPTASRVD